MHSLQGERELHSPESTCSLLKAKAQAGMTSFPLPPTPYVLLPEGVPGRAPCEAEAAGECGAWLPSHHLQQTAQAPLLVLTPQEGWTSPVPSRAQTSPDSSLILPDPQGPPKPPSWGSPPFPLAHPIPGSHPDPRYPQTLSQSLSSSPDPGFPRPPTTQSPFTAAPPKSIPTSSPTGLPPLAPARPTLWRPLPPLPGALPACLSSCSNCFQICVGGQGPGVLLHAKFINRAVFPDGRWLQPGEQVDWDQNNNRWRADNEFLDT